MKSLYLLLTSLIYCGLIYNASCDGPSQSEQAWGDECQGIRISLSLVRDTMEPGTNLQLYITLKNVSNQEEQNQRYCITGTRKGFDFIITDASGNKLPITPEEMTKAVMTCDLPPGGIIKTELDLSSVCDLNLQPGKYTIQVSRKFPLLSFGIPKETKNEVKSNIATFTVAK